MKLVDEKGKLFGKWNVLDCCILLLVVVLLAGAYYKFRGQNKTNISLTTEPITYTVEVKRIREYVYQNVKEGDLLYDKVSGNCIGKIQKVEGRPATEPLACWDGQVRTAQVQNRIDVVFTVSADGFVDGDGSTFATRTYELVRGSTKRFMTKYFECEGKVKDIL